MSTVGKSAVEIAASVASGQISARSVVDDSLAQIAALDGELNAFNYVMVEEARNLADEIDAKIARGENPGPLAGVPVALKDNICTRGVPTTCSSNILAGWRPPYDATVVRNIVAAGGIPIGKTNLDEFAMGSSTENSAFGASHNPRDPSKVPGGSSGGSVVAVASAMTPLSLGSDTGGSIRQPASLCGAVGVKPTYGYVSRYGLIAFGSSLDQIGPIANTVADAALMLEVLGSPDPEDSTCIGSPRAPLMSELNKGVEGLRVGVLTELMKGASPDVIARVQEAAQMLEKNGATVGEASVPAASYGLSAYYLLAPAEASSNLARFDGVRYGLRIANEGEDITDMYGETRAKGFGAEVKRRIMLGTYALSAGYYDAYYGKAQRVRRMIANDFAAAYQNFDVLLSPVSPTTAFALGEKASDPLTMYLADVCTIPTNLAGHPAMSVPYGVGDDGMPIGVQVLAPAMAEPMMFRVAAVLEANATGNLAPGARAQQVGASK